MSACLALGLALIALLPSQSAGEAAYKRSVRVVCDGNDTGLILNVCAFWKMTLKGRTWSRVVRLCLRRRSPLLMLLLWLLGLSSCCPLTGRMECAGFLN